MNVAHGAGCGARRDRSDSIRLVPSALCLEPFVYASFLKGQPSGLKRAVRLNPGLFTLPSISLIFSGMLGGHEVLPPDRSPARKGGEASLDRRSLEMKCYEINCCL